MMREKRNKDVEAVLKDFFYYLSEYGEYGASTEDFRHYLRVFEIKLSE